MEQQQQSLPSTPLQSHMDVQMQHLGTPMLTRSKRRNTAQQRIEQQVPTLMPHATAADITASNAHASEREIEADFQAQIQPILELYLQRTRRSNPINSILDMSNCVQF